MFYLRRPSEEVLRRLLSQCPERELTYAAVGATAGEPPARFAVDRWGVDLGSGEACFERARAAIDGFRMYPRWTFVVRDFESPAVGAHFVAVISHLGFWSANPCRIVHVVHERNERMRYGFALGTVEGHPEEGEERFTVTWDRATDAVRYDVVAFSRPRVLLARLGKPVVRHLQRRFHRDSQAQMVEAVSDRDARSLDV